MNDNKSIRINAVLNIIYTISNILFPIITFPYVSRILLADGIGRVSFYSAIGDYAIMLASLGVTTYGIRETARVRDSKRELSKTVTELLVINTLSSLIVVVSLFLMTIYIDRFQKDLWLLILNCLSIVATPIGMNWLFSGLEQYSYITKRSILFKFISLIFILLFVKNSGDYIIYAAIITFSVVSSYIINFFYSMKFISFKSLPQLEFQKHFKPMLLLFASVLAVNVYTNLDTVMLGFISGDRDVGLYTVAVKVKWLLLSVVNAISAVLLPRLSYYLNEKRVDEYNSILKKSILVIFFISTPLTLFFMVNADNTIMILGGPSYSDAVLCMQIIIPILLISGFSNITGNQILIPFGKDSCFMKAVIVGATIDVVFNIALMPRFGYIGAAIATLIAEFAQMSVQLMYSKNIISDIFPKKSVFKIFISAILGAVIIFLIKPFLTISKFNYTINSFITIFISSFFYLVVYFTIIYLSKEEYFRELVKEISSVFKRNK